MHEDEQSDLLIAIAIGAVLGVGATLLIRSGRPERKTARLIRELEPIRRDVHRRLADARSELRHGRQRVARAGTSAADSAREAIDDFREEVAGIVSEARDEIVRTARETARGGERALRRARRGR